jgi:hypothetical protein
MATLFKIIRPDDLLNLRIEATNLELKSGSRKQPELTIRDESKPAYLSIIFPPQTITERAYFEASIVDGENNPDKPDPDEGSSVIEPLDPPGFVDSNRPAVAQLGKPSRLVFKVPKGKSIPFTLEGLLDWSDLELNVNPIAAIGEQPTQDQINNAPNISEPGSEETAIELPYRLVISPNKEVSWKHRKTPFTSRGRTELWHTRLALKIEEETTELSRTQHAPLRAIWSADYNPNNIPEAGHDPDLQRTSMDANDRHQIVVLTSAFKGYEVDVEVILNLGISPGFASTTRSRNTARFNVPKGSLQIAFKHTVPYVPKPFKAEQLMLTPLGGWLKSHGSWNPPRTKKPAVPPVFNFNDTLTVFEHHFLQERNSTDISAFNIFEGNIPDSRSFLRLPQPEQYQLDLSEWKHIATQGRDHYVRIVYEGELWPFRHRAALIKVTERKFKEANGIIGAYQIQRMFIVVREPVKIFDDDDRANPLKKVRLTTLITPDIADPDLIADTHRSFWVEVMTSAADRDFFKFHAVGTDISGSDIDFTVPLMFVSISDVADTENLKKVAREYNDKDNIGRRSVHIPGQKVVFAQQDSNSDSQSENTQLVTQSMNFVVDKTGSPPKMLKADVNIPQVEDLLGTNAPATIRFYSDYVKKGFDEETGVFAEIVKEDLSSFDPDDPFAAMVPETLGVDFSSDQAGGFATPNVGISSLTRKLGPLAGKVEDATTNTFDPAEFFKGGLAKLFGSFDLKDLLPAGSLGKNAPKMTSETGDIPGGKLLIAKLDWEPEVKDLDLGVAAFKKDHNGTTKLIVHGRIEKPVKPDDLGAPLTDGIKFEFNGKLNDFRISVLKSVFINFSEFRFEARSGSKTDVDVKLDPAKPLEFAGDLQFVEELRKTIPPDLFGDGPSLDITDTGIRAGFAFSLPPVAVGVFSLRDISLGAALTLPFTDGKPVFDFRVSERSQPFLLSVSIFGGGGFFLMQLDTSGLKQIEAAFEFGVTAALDIGVASGEVHMMAGIYFSLQRDDNTNEMIVTLTGYLRIGGSLNVLGLIKVSVEFNLSFSYVAEKKAYGRATLTVHVEVLFFSASVELTVERSFGGTSGDPTFGQMFTTKENWSEYALAFAA